MSGQGYHFAINDDLVKNLLACRDEMQVLDVIDALLETCGNDPDTVAGGSKRWGVLHRCLCDGTYSPKGGSYPLNQCFLGGRLLATEGSIVNLVMPKGVVDVADALSVLNDAWFRQRFIAVFAAEYADGDLGGDLEELVEEFDELRSFYFRAARSGGAVVFYTDDPLSLWLPPEAS